jgi:hypothetical protein
MNNTLTTTRGCDYWREVCKHFDNSTIRSTFCNTLRRNSDIIIHPDHTIFPLQKNRSQFYPFINDENTIPVSHCSVTLPDIFAKPTELESTTNIDEKVKEEIGTPEEGQEQFQETLTPHFNRINGVKSAMDYHPRIDTTKQVTSKNYGYNCYPSTLATQHFIKRRESPVSRSLDGIVGGHIGQHLANKEQSRVQLVKTRQLKPMTPLHRLDGALLDQ